MINRERLISLAKAQMLKKRDHSHRETGFAFYHGLRTARLSIYLREHIFPEHTEMDDILFAAGLFHDIGKLEPPHNQSGSRMVRALLPEELTPAVLLQVAEIVLLHTKHGTCQAGYPDCVNLVMDADVIDHYGCMDIWVNLYHCALEDQTPAASIRYFQSVTQQEQAEFNETMLYYPLSRQIQQERFTFEQAFFERLQRESQGEVL